MSDCIKRLPDSELEIMMVVWGADGPVTSSYVRESLKETKQWKITSVLTFLSRLVEKGFLSCTREGKTNFYSAQVGEQEYLQKESRSFLERLYGNSLPSLVASLYRGKAVSEEDLLELRRSIDEMTGGK